MKKEEILFAEDKDSAKISKLIKDTVKKINSKDISKEQAKAWQKNHSTKNISKWIKNTNFFCFQLNNNLIGVAWIKRNFLKGFYISANYIKKGYGKNLLKFIEDYAKSKGLKKIVLNSSKTAFGFYKKRGYIFRRMAYSKLLNVNFQEYRMEKFLK